MLSGEYRETDLTLLLLDSTFFIVELNLEICGLLGEYVSELLLKHTD